ncbi:MAG TPA: putative DNA binding domain-containing protein [Bacteroidota bacterium]|jgi:predicted HTH transcriptional regulator|nr:putative DNA binding domain-containing protein [Bacteroidota bacterium]
MNQIEFNEILEKGENNYIEFKRKVSSLEKIAKEVIAFANTKGGKIFFGVDDDGKIYGVESEKSEIDLIEESCKVYCNPPISPEIEIFHYKGKDIIIANIPESINKPHFLFEGNLKLTKDSKVYIRVNDKSVLASKEVIQVLRNERPDAKPVKISIGENEKRLLDFVEKNERITVKQFSELVNISERRASRILVKLVQLGVLRIHTLEKEDYFTLSESLT